MMLGEITEFWIKSSSQALSDFLELLIEQVPSFPQPWKEFDTLDGEKKQKKDKSSCYIVQVLKHLNLQLRVHKIRTDAKTCLLY